MSHTKVKGHLRSRCKCKSGYICKFDYICPFLLHIMTNCNQTLVIIDATWKPSYVNEVKGHIPRSSEVKM